MSKEKWEKERSHRIGVGMPASGQSSAPARARAGVMLAAPSILVSSAVGAAVGGHLWRGMSRADVKEFGDVIDAGQAALIVVDESTIEAAIQKAQLKAEKRVAKELNVNTKDIDKAVQDSKGP